MGAEASSAPNFFTMPSNSIDTYYQEYPKFHVAVDCIIFGFERRILKVLLQKRPFEPHQGEWSLMGGFVQQDEDTDQAAKRVLHQLTGLKNVYMSQVGAFGTVTRDSGSRVISIAYFALLDIDRVNKNLRHMYSAYWEEMSNLPPLLFDHAEMIQGAIEKLRSMINHKPVGFQLLPASFTLADLQTLYEAILGEKVDKRNFRKRVNEMSFIEKTGEKNRSFSKRSAALYRFNPAAYKKLPYFKL